METKKTERNSSIEMFRILATFLVVVVHFNGWFAGGLPEKMNLYDITDVHLGQIIIQSLSVICVNCFVIISGYFGIKFNLKTFWNMFIILLSVYIPCMFLDAYLNNTPYFSLNLFISNILVFSRESYFVQCYLMLVFLSPILNTFIEKMRNDLLYYSLIFCLIEFWFDCVRGNISLGFNHGYSVIHFVLLYLLARSLYLYKNSVLKINKIFWIIGYFLCTSIIIMLYFFGVKWTFWYSNIIVVISSFCLFIPFLYFSLYSKVINSIANSTFMVYLIHTCNPFCDIFKQFDTNLLNTNTYGAYLLYIFFTIVGIFICCVLYDKLRIILIGSISNKCFNILFGKINSKFFLYGK